MEIFTPKVIDNIDVMSIILSFLNRKIKFNLSQVNKDFYNMIVPRSMVSLRFMTNKTIENEKFTYQLGRFIKV